MAAQNKGDDEIVLAATSSDEELHNGFLLDSACTEHMSNDKSRFVNMRKSSEKYVLVGNGEKLNVNGVGDILINVDSMNGNSRKCTLKNVLYVPNLRHNLLSISKISAGGKNVSFSQNLCKISVDSTTLAYGKKVGKLFILKESSRRFENSAKKDHVFYPGWKIPRRSMKENGSPGVYALTAVNLSASLSPSTRLRIRCRNYVDCNHRTCR